MELIPIENIRINARKIAEIDNIVKSIYRLIIYSRYHLDDDLLDIYVTGVNDLKEQLSIKNAQMEAQNEEEAIEYVKNLKVSLDFVFSEIVLHQNLCKEIQLFQLLRLVSPETNALHQSLSTYHGTNWCAYLSRPFDGTKFCVRTILSNSTH
ncbi:hypothetical protein [Aquirufa salirivi]|uniref:Uncharacterized protein n=1 Tax=Aquirufa salirivi TaxID=3104729 RepID=A0ABW8RYM3_9BACT